MSDETPRERLERLFNEYVAVTKEAFETEGHFYAARPRTPELGAKHRAAYEAFDVVRQEVLTQERKEPKS